MAHIYYKDIYNIDKRSKIAVFIVFIVNILILYSYIELIFPYNFLFAIFAIFFQIMIGSIVSTKRYWKQIAELRADRLSIQICDKEKEPFIEYWNDRDRNHKIEKNSFIVRYYRKYIKNEAHPSMKRRMGLLKNRNRWYIWDYIEHAMVIRVWRITNRGWNGYKQV